MLDGKIKNNEILLKVTDVAVEYKVQGKTFAAISNINLSISKGETLGLVGESGCGKSTMGKAIMQLPGPTSGSVRFLGQEITGLSYTEMRPIRKRMQIIFQDPISSLNPRRRVRNIIAEPLVISGVTGKDEINHRVRAALSTVGMDPDNVLDRRPHQFSGGQCQRICIARALILEPDLIICDEPVSSLDVSVQAQILNLLEDMKERYGLTLLFISHDLAVVKNISDRVAVMYLGKVCELSDSDQLYRKPAHPYTAGLIKAIPEICDKSTSKPQGLRGEIPSPLNPPSGCRFRNRCPLAQDKCASIEPSLEEITPGHQIACHFPL